LFFLEVFFELQTNALLSIIATKHCHQRVWFRFKYQQNNVLDNLLGYNNHQETKAFKTSLLDKHICKLQSSGCYFFPSKYLCVRTCSIGLSTCTRVFPFHIIRAWLGLWTMSSTKSCACTWSLRCSCHTTPRVVHGRQGPYVFVEMMAYK
jgi:hypothetical protein